MNTRAAKLFKTTITRSPFSSYVSFSVEDYPVIGEKRLMQAQRPHLML